MHTQRRQVRDDDSAQAVSGRTRRVHELCHIQPLSILDSEIRRLEEGNLIVGLIDGASYTSARCILQPAERILPVTDGITEAEDNAGKQFGDSGLGIVAHYDNLDSILDRVAKFQAPNSAQDDCTLLEIRYVGLADSPD
jgi:sigma-B regulation protein RsbU (phosphoserine phosphatase)